MKKTLLVICALFLAFGLSAQEAEKKVKGAHPYKVSENDEVAEKLAHVSLTPHVGFNYFDGDFNSEMKHSIAVPTAGLDIEYSFNPVWSLGAAYTFDMYNVTGKPGGHNVDTLLNGHMHKAGLYVSMDFMPLFFPKAKKKVCGIEAIIGGGYTWYKSTTMYHDDESHGRGHTDTYVNKDGVVGPDYMTDYAGQLYLQAGLNVEFNLNRTLALGVRATYNYFINDYIDGRGYEGMNAVASKNNDGIVDVTLNMRFKLAAVSKTHVRNINSLDMLAKQEEQKKEPQCVHDTVIVRHDSIIVREVVKEVRETNTTTVENDRDVYYVYFDNGKSVIREDGLITIQQVADRLAEEPDLYAVVTGFCDNTGSNSLNYTLGDKRAANVIDELREEHGVADDHMYSAGMGKLVGRRSTGTYGPNRRAAIRLVDKATFDRMKAELEDKVSHRNQDEVKPEAEPQKPAPVHTVPIAESQRQEKVNEYAFRLHEKTKTEKTTTLSKLARQYYNNTHCWVYIYVANKDVIPNPHALEPGVTLIIPELTEQEMQITKDQCLRLYNNARAGK